MAAAPPPCCVPAAWVGVGSALRHSKPQCKGGMPGSFGLREDMGADRLQGWLLKRLLRSTLSTGLGPRRQMVVVEVVDAAGSVAGTGRRNSLTSKISSPHFLHGLGAAADARGDAPGGAAKPVVLGVQAAPSGTRGMGNPAAVKRF